MLGVGVLYGVLQERLNRDANELGNNLILFPARNIQRVTFILSNLSILFTDIPRPLLLPCFLPCFRRRWLTSGAVRVGNTA